MVNINLRTYYTAIELIRNFVNNKTIDKDFFNEKFMNMPNEENSQAKNENTGEEASMANKAYKENSQATNNVGENNSEANNIGRFYYIAKKHNLVSLMEQAMEKMGFESDSDIWKRWLKEKNQLIYKSVLMDVEREAIQDFFEENNIPYNKLDIHNPENLNNLIKIGGEKQVPFLDDKDNNVSMYESEDIIKYVKSKV